MSTQIKRVILPLFALGLLLYFHALWAPFYLLDISKVVENSAARNPFAWHVIWNAARESFLTGFTFALNYYVHGLTPFGYRLVNVVIHIGVSILVYFLLLAVFKAEQGKRGSKKYPEHEVSLIGALLFLAHPVQTESIAYITQRETCLAVLFYVASVLGYIQWRIGGKTRNFVLSLLAAFAAFFSGKVAFSLPLVILACEYFLFQTPPQTKSDLRRIFVLISYFAASFAVLCLFYGADVLRHLIDSFPNGTHLVSDSDWANTKLHSFLTSLQLLFSPLHQNLDYGDKWIHNWDVLSCAALGLLIAVFGIGVLFARKNQPLGFGVFWFLLAFGMSSQSFLEPQIFSEHSLYLPMVGSSLVFSSVSVALIKNDNGKSRMVLWFLILSFFSVLTVLRNRLWNDDLKMWQDVVEKSTGNARALTELGQAYERRSDVTHAIESYQKAIDAKPEYSRPYFYLGALYENGQDLNKALEYYWGSLKRNEEDVQTFRRIAISYGKRGDLDRKIDFLKKALEASPYSSEVHYELARAYHEKRMFGNAIRHYTKATELDPRYADAFLYLGLAHRDQGELEKAKGMLLKALELNPGNELARASLEQMKLDSQKK